MTDWREKVLGGSVDEAVASAAHNKRVTLYFSRELAAAVASAAQDSGMRRQQWIREALAEQVWRQTGGVVDCLLAGPKGDG